MATERPNVSLKGGGGYEVPWIVLPWDNPDQLHLLLDGLTPELMAKIAAKAQEFQNIVKLTADGATAVPQNPVAAAVTPPPAAAPVQPQQPNQQAAQPQTAWTNPPQQQGFDGSPDPLGRVCGSCGQGVRGKEIRSKKNGNTYQLWVCPNQRNKDDGHFSEFVK